MLVHLKKRTPDKIGPLLGKQTNKEENDTDSSCTVSTLRRFTQNWSILVI